jgi:hypothetical protein
MGCWARFEEEKENNPGPILSLKNISISICKIKYKSTSPHNKICNGMNATNNYLFK